MAHAAANPLSLTSSISKNIDLEPDGSMTRNSLPFTQIVMAAASLRRLLLVVLLAVSASARLIAATVTVEEACEHMKHRAFCVEALSARPESKTAGDLLALAGLSLSLAAEHAAETATFLRSLGNTPGGTPAECLEGCAAKLQAAVAGLTLSEAALREDVAGVKARVSAARADGGACLDGCRKVEGGADPRVEEKVSELGKLCSVALALTNAATHDRGA